MTSHLPNTATLRQSLFVEQAEYLEPDWFEEWTTTHPDEEAILRKLTQAGAKLLTGPRGCGKTTLLLKAYNQLLDDPQSSALPLYVNFKSSLKLEPLYRTNANAVYWFNQWLLLKAYQGLYQTVERLSPRLSELLRYPRGMIERVAGQLELGQTELPSNDSVALTISEFEEDLVRVLDQINRPRCVLLLDDAAHAFSPEQQRDFFDFFRQVKSRRIAPKAAIYPGVTVYSSTFHLGHDAEEIDVWLKPFASGYMEFMFSLLEKRLPPDVVGALKKDEALLKLLCYAAFGMPRSLLNMVRRLYADDDHAPSGTRISFSRQTVVKSIKDVLENTLGVYSSLRLKLPMYAAFVTTGESVYQRMLAGIKTYNRDKAIERQSVSAAVLRPVVPELEKVLGFFQYAGLVLPSGTVSRGVKGVFGLHTLHYAALIDSNAILGRKSVAITDLVKAFERRHSHEFTRFSARSLIGDVSHEEAFKLSLPPCQVCRTPRVNETARFCLNCGAQLKSVSVFESLVNQGIEKLPLTPQRTGKIKEHSQIRTVKDILMDYENRELRKVPQIGPYWAQRIFRYAEEFIA